MSLLLFLVTYWVPETWVWEVPWRNGYYRVSWMRLFLIFCQITYFEKSSNTPIIRQKMKKNLVKTLLAPYPHPNLTYEFVLQLTWWSNCIRKAFSSSSWSLYFSLIFFCFPFCPLFIWEKGCCFWPSSSSTMTWNVEKSIISVQKFCLFKHEFYSVLLHITFIVTVLYWDHFIDVLYWDHFSL